VFAIKSPLTYLHQPGLRAHVGEYISSLAKNIAIITSQTAWKSVNPELENSLQSHNIAYQVEFLKGECTEAAIAEHAGKVKAQGAGVVLGIGGGRVLDTAKAVGNRFDNVAIITFPTIAATCAAWSPVTVLYNEAGGQVGGLPLHRMPERVFVDTEVIAKSDVRYLKAGIVDSLAKWYEFRPYQQKSAESLALNFKVQAARYAAEVFDEFGRQAVEDNLHHRVTPALIKVIDANIAAAGMANSMRDEFSSPGVAHAIHNRLTHQPEVHDWLHGEKVGFGLLVQSYLESGSEKADAKLVALLKQFDAPLQLPELHGNRAEALRVIAEQVEFPAQVAARLPFVLSPATLLKALQATENTAPSALILSERIQRVTVSGIAKAKQLTDSLKEAGVDILDMTTGEPDFDTPNHVKQAAYAAIERGETKYTAVSGIKPLRQAVQRKLQRENHLAYDIDQIVIANGAKQIIFNTFAATLNKGDEVLIPVPFWPSFPDSVRFNGGTPVLLSCPVEQEYKLTPAQLEQAITPQTRWLVFNNPSNPSGAVYDRTELTALAEVIRRHPQVWVLLDELYEHVLFDEREHLGLLNVAPDLRERALLVGGVSKTYAMTGWRIGYAAGPKALAQALALVQLQTTSGASSVSQAAAVAAFDSGLDFLKPQVAAYQYRRDVLVDALSKIEGLKLLSPQGAFFVFCQCEGLLGRQRPDGKVLASEADVVEYILENGVSGVGGSTYGLSPYFRLSIATDNATVEEAGRRITAAIERLK
jgi:aspartate aminotransferase